MDILSVNDVGGSDLHALAMSFLLSGGIMAAAAAIGGRATRARRFVFGALGAFLLLFASLFLLEVITSFPLGRSAKSAGFVLLGPWVGAVWSIVSLFKRPKASGHRNAAVAQDVQRARQAVAQAQQAVRQSKARRQHEAQAGRPQPQWGQAPPAPPGQRGGHAAPQPSPQHGYAPQEWSGQNRR